MPRAFLALELDDAARDVFTAAAEAFRALAPAWAGEKWVPAANLHVTLRFLGDVPDGDVPALASAAADALCGLRAPVLTPDGVRTVPSPRSARMLWGVMVDEDGAAAAIAEALASATAPFAAEGDDKPFRAHVTLVRARTPRHAPAEALAAADAQVRASARPMSVPCVTLFSSDLAPGGPRYETIGRLPVGRA